MRIHISILTVVITTLIFSMPEWSISQRLPEIGFKIGVNGSKLTPENVTFIESSNFTEFGNFEYKPGTVIGAFIRYSFKKYFTFQPEINYIFKGAKVQEISGEFDNASLDLNFIEVPLLVGFSLSPDSPTSTVFFGGPVVSFLHKAEIFRDITRDDITDVSELFEKKDAGLLLGIGLKMNRLTVEFRYYDGFVGYDKTSQNKKTYNRVLIITANFVLKGGKL